MEIVYNGEMDKRACKEVLGRVIPQLVKEDPEIVYLDADLMSCIGTLKGTRDVADRAINCGIAEANMIGVACGLASAGFKPIVHTFGPFASRRCFDQVFLSAGYAKNDITIIGTDPGVMAAMNGGTHMPFEDMAMYNTIPGATIIDVTDPTLLESAIRQCVNRKGVKYIRVGRKQYAKVYAEGSEVPIGKATVLREGGDAVVFASGIMVHEAMKAADILAAEGIQAEVWKLNQISPLDHTTICEALGSRKTLLVLEDSFGAGCVGQRVAAILAEHGQAPEKLILKNLGKTFAPEGSVSQLEHSFGLDAAAVAEAVREAAHGK